MPDITMCSGQNCPIKQSCYRFTAKPSRYQSYADFAYQKVVVVDGQKQGGCDDFWDNEAGGFKEKDQCCMVKAAILISCLAILTLAYWGLYVLLEYFCPEDKEMDS